MASSDTGDLGTLTFISYAVVDPDSTGEKFIRVRYSLDVASATEALEGFLLWHDDEAGVTTPVWVNAADAKLAGGGDYGAPTIYEVLVPAPLDDVAMWWESFEEYEDGSNVALTAGGAGWDGGWVESETTPLRSAEDFESYTNGTYDSGDLAGGTGWASGWIEGL